MNKTSVNGVPSIGATVSTYDIMSITVELLGEFCDTERHTEEINGIAGPSQPPATIIAPLCQSPRSSISMIGSVGKGGHAELTQKRSAPTGPRSDPGELQAEDVPLDVAPVWGGSF